MNSITEILKEVGIFYVATVDENGDPRVRPFGTVAEIDGETYICTGNFKKCYKQMMEHSTVEISGMFDDDNWMRMTADVVRVDSDELREAFLEQCPHLKLMYNLGDGLFEVLKLTNVKGAKYNFSGAYKKF